MDFELREEQEALRQVVRDLVERDCPPSLVRAVVEGDDRSGELWKSLVQHEWTGLTIPVEHGGSGATAVELVLVLEELGWASDPTPFLATTSLFVPMVTESEPPESAALLAAVCGGGTGTASFDASDVHATRQAGEWRLTGRAERVLDADRADEIAVAATTDDGLGVFVTHGAAVTATRKPSFDANVHVATITLDDVAVPFTQAAIGTHIARGVAHAREHAVLAVAASTVGACQRILELTLDHVRNRKQFDVPIGSFQAVKHMAVDMYVAVERARALCHFAALTISEDDPRRSVAVSMAKAAAGEAQRLVARHGMQLFGGLGFTWENDLQLFVRRAKAGEHLFGSAAGHRQRVARTLLTEVAR